MTQTEVYAQLDQLVAAALDRWPEFAYRTASKRRNDISRAHVAARYIHTGAVNFVEELPSLIDCWQVNGHQCSYHGKICDYLDLDAPYDAELGRLCKHRLAVMFAQELQAQQLAYLHNLFAHCNAQRVLSIKREVRTHYVNNLHRQGSELIAWQPKGYEPFVLASPVDFTIRQLQDILGAAGWRVTPGARVNQYHHIRGREHWFFELTPADAGADPRIATLIGHLYGIEQVFNPRVKHTEPRLIIRFHGKKLALACNKTQVASLERITGVDDYTKWPGHAVALASGRTNNGQETIIISVAPKPSPIPPAETVNDDWTFFECMCSVHCDFSSPGACRQAVALTPHSPAIPQSSLGGHQTCSPTPSRGVCQV